MEEGGYLADPRSRNECGEEVARAFRNLAKFESSDVNPLTGIGIWGDLNLPRPLGYTPNWMYDKNKELILD